MKRIHILAACLAATLVLPGYRAVGFVPEDPGPAIDMPAESNAMNALAERYVKLVLAMGQHDPDYVDAYYGPPEWRKEAEAAKRPLAAIDADAAAVLQALEKAAPERSAEELVRLRHQYLTKQLQALRVRASMLQGRKLSFDEEARALYDAVPPVHTEQEFQAIVDELAKRLPGSGTVAERYDAFRSGFVIPKERLDTVFQAAIAGCRARTAEHITLPPEERFTVEYVTGKSWSGYNWYQGGYRSIIQVNTDLPIFIDRAIDLACHEGYPGHHVYNSLLEKTLVRERGWVEFSIYALFSAQSLIAEGSANYGIDVAFPANERVEMEAHELFPLAALDASRAEQYYRLYDLVARTGDAGNEAARRYLDGDFTADEAAEWLTTYALMEPARARQRVKFFDKYRSYVINYNYGKDLVKAYVERQDGDRWEVFADLLASPRLPSALMER